MIDNNKLDEKVTISDLKNMDNNNFVNLAKVEGITFSHNWSNELIVNELVELYIQDKDDVIFSMEKVSFNDELQIINGQEALDAYYKLKSFGYEPLNFLAEKRKREQALFILDHATEKEIERKLYDKSKIFRKLQFEKMSPYMSDRQYWELLSLLHTGVESFNDEDNPDIFQWWQEKYTADRSNREYIMTEEERKVFNALPDKITVFRGLRVEEELYEPLGFSWTLDKKKAEWFAQRFWKGTPIVIEAIVDKSNCIGYLTENAEEEEILVLNVSKEEVKVYELD